MFLRQFNEGLVKATIIVVIRLVCKVTVSLRKVFYAEAVVDGLGGVRMWAQVAGVVVALAPAPVGLRPAGREDRGQGRDTTRPHLATTVGRHSNAVSALFRVILRE